MDWLYDDTNDSFSMRVGDFISPRGILLADITEATYMVKERMSDSDATAIVTLTLGAGLTLVAGDTEADATLRVQFQDGNFGPGKLEINKRYYAGFGIKAVGWSKFLEIRLEDNRIKILADIIHD